MGLVSGWKFNPGTMLIHGTSVGLWPPALDTNKITVGISGIAGMPMIGISVHLGLHVAMMMGGRRGPSGMSVDTWDPQHTAAQSTGPGPSHRELQKSGEAEGTRSTSTPSHEGVHADTSFPRCAARASTMCQGSRAGNTSVLIWLKTLESEGRRRMHRACAQVLRCS